MADAPILALDFDGVIADSILECLVVSWNAYMAYMKKSDRIFSAGSLDTAYQSAFRHLRNFIRTGEDYLMIHIALNQGDPINDQTAFDGFAGSLTDQRPRLREHFYRARTSFYKSHPEEWLSLNPLYPGMKNFLQTWVDPDRLFIISTKRSDFISAILAGQGISFPVGNLFYAGPGRSKRAIIEELLNRDSLLADGFYFVDDQVDTLIKVQPTGVHCILAQWGYNREVQQGQAERAGIDTVTLDMFLRQWQQPV